MSEESPRYAHDQGHTDICFSEDGSKFITCGTDGDIRIWTTENWDDPINNGVGEWAISVAQKGDKVYVSTDSNDVAILSLSDGTKISMLDRFTAPINHIAVDKHSELIAFVGEGKEVKLINPNDSEKKDIKIFEGLTGPGLSVAVSSKSKMIAASSGDTKLRIWNYETTELLHELSCFPKVNSFSNAKLMCRMDFEPINGTKLAYPQKNTVVILRVSDWSKTMTLECNEIESLYSIVQFSPCGKYLMASAEADFVVWNLATEEILCIDKNPNNATVCGLMWNPQGNGQVLYTDVEGQLGALKLPIRQSSKTNSSVSVTASDLAKDFVDEVRSDLPGSRLSDLTDMELDVLDREHEYAKSDVSVVSSKSSYHKDQLQQAFMPGSTPEHLDPRYLCWNEVGIVRCFKNTTENSAQQSIEVEFHDSNFHSSMMINGYEDYTMASLSKTALLVANTSLIHVVPLMANKKKWTFTVPENQEIVVVTASENLIAFVTGRSFVNVFGTYGTQRGSFSIPGPVLSMAAYENVIMIAYHSGRLAWDRDVVNIKLVTFEGTSIQSTDIGSALQTGSTLMWLGFSDTGTPSMMDSFGIVSIYPQHCNSNVWIPVCDTRRYTTSPSDGFFITTIFESNETIGGVRCKGTIYPGFIPRPTMSELPIAAQFADIPSDKTKLEGELFAWSNLKIPENDKRFKSSLLKAFALACKNDFDERALEIIEIYAPDVQTVSMAQKFAAKLDKKRLTEKLTDLLKFSNDVEDTVTNPEVSEVKENKPFKRLSLIKSKRLTKSQSEPVPEKISSTPHFEEVETQEAGPSTQGSEVTDLTCNETVTDSMIEEMEAKEQYVNPFLKRLKKPTVTKESNPLSLIDKYAGVTYESSKENRNKNGDAGDKRKLDGGDTDKPKGKQRKLDMFAFKKPS